jgi:hypothetical protein
MTKKFGSLVFVLVALPLVAHADTTRYTDINSNGGESIWGEGSSASSAQLMRAVRSLAQSRHPNGGPDTWTCAASGDLGRCRGDDGGVLWVGQCHTGAATRTCQFGTGEVGSNVEGEMGWNLDNLTFANWRFVDGGSAVSSYTANTFTYTD